MASWCAHLARRRFGLLVLVVTVVAADLVSHARVDGAAAASETVDIALDERSMHAVAAPSEIQTPLAIVVIGGLFAATHDETEQLLPNAESR